MLVILFPNFNGGCQVENGRVGEEAIRFGLSRRDFLKLTGAGIVVLSVDGPSSFAQTINSELNGYGAYGAHGDRGNRISTRHEPWNDSLTVARTLVTHSDLTRPSKLDDNARITPFAGFKNFLNDSPIARIEREIKSDLLTIATYEFLNLRSLDPFSHMNIEVAKAIIDLGLKFDSYGNMDIAHSEKPKSAGETVNDLNDLADQAALKNKIDKSATNAVDRMRSERDLEHYHVRDPAERSHSEIDRSQYERETRETRDHTA